MDAEIKRVTLVALTMYHDHLEEEAENLQRALKVFGHNTGYYEDLQWTLDALRAVEEALDWLDSQPRT